MAELARSSGWKLVDKTGNAVPATALEGKPVALYFSAHWCPPCRGFTPMLKKFYEEAKAAGGNLEIVFVSSDRTEAEGQEYFREHHGDWLMLDYEFAQKQKGDLDGRYEIGGIPSLVVVDSSGKAVEPNARDSVAQAASGGPEAAKAAAAAWEKLCGDWRQTTGTSLGGASGGDAEYMRACRLARLEGRPPPPPPVVAPVAEAPAPAAAAPAAIAPAAALPAPAPSAPVDSAAVSQLTDMGFGAEQAAQALASTGGDVDAAAAVLLGGDADADMQEPPVRADAPVEVTEAAVEQLAAMGFPADQAREALAATGGSVENAMAVLLGD